MVTTWLSNNFIEIFGAVTGIIYVILEIRQTIWLWPLGIITSGVYVWIFFTNKLYADMSLQAYYVIISVLGWYWWMKGSGRRAPDSYREGAERRAEGDGQRAQNAEIIGNSPFEGGQGDVHNLPNNKSQLKVSRLKTRTGFILAFVFLFLFVIMWYILSRFTDSPVPQWDAFLTSLSIVATWMLARKIYEHWYLWIVVNIISMFLYFSRGLYPTVVLYAVYASMSFIGLAAWKKSIDPVLPVADNS
jgi:nicotinamide mononucleotide transporter